MMISLEQAKQLIGMPVLTPAAGMIKIKKVRQLKNGTILVYNEHGWCCNVEIIRNMKKEKFTFDEVKEIKGDT